LQGNFFCSTPLILLHIGTSLRYRPGIVVGGSGLQHECGTSRSIGYFLEPLVCVALFGRKVGSTVTLCKVYSCCLWCAAAVGGVPSSSQQAESYIRRQSSLPSLQPLGITLRGITNSAEDPSVDVWRAVTLPLLRKVIGADGQLQLKIARRGAPPKVCSGNASTCGPGSQQTDERYFLR
jgi:RNA 3'-terminal phosphate cyclase-like protein